MLIKELIRLITISPDDTSLAPQHSNLPGDLLFSESNTIISMYDVLCIHSG